MSAVELGETGKKPGDPKYEAKTDVKTDGKAYDAKTDTKTDAKASSSYTETKAPAKAGEYADGKTDAKTSSKDYGETKTDKKASKDYGKDDGEVIQGYGGKKVKVGIYDSASKKIPKLRPLAERKREIFWLKITNTLQFCVSLAVLIIALVSDQKRTLSLTIGTIACPVISLLIAILGGVNLFIVVREDTVDTRRHGHTLFLLYIVLAVLTTVIACLFTAGSEDALLGLEIVQILLLISGILLSMRVYEDVYHVLHVIAQILNLWLYLLGALVLVTGVYFAKANVLTDYNTGVPQTALVMFAVLGGGIVLVACLGFFGITRNNKYMMAVYEFFMLFAFVGLLIVGAVVLRWDVRDEVQNSCSSLLKAGDLTFWHDTFGCDKYYGFTVDNPITTVTPNCMPKTDLVVVYEAAINPYPVACLNHECCNRLTDYIVASAGDIYALGLALFLTVVFLIVATYLFIVRDVQREKIPGDECYDVEKDKDLMYLTTFKSNHPEDTCYFGLMVLILIILIIILVVDLTKITPLSPVIVPPNTFIPSNETFELQLGLLGCALTNLSSRFNISGVNTSQPIQSNFTLAVGRGIFQYNDSDAQSLNIIASTQTVGQGSKAFFSGEIGNLVAFVGLLQFCPLCVDEITPINVTLKQANASTQTAVQNVVVRSTRRVQYRGNVVARLNASSLQDLPGVFVAVIDGYSCVASRANTTTDANGGYLFDSLLGPGTNVALHFDYSKPLYQPGQQSLEGYGLIANHTLALPLMVLTPGPQTLCPGPCHPNVTCTNIIGSPGFACGVCPAGFQGNGVGLGGCTDVDECPTRPCDVLSNCTNNWGGFTCTPCPKGYSGNPRVSCSDIDECVNNPCSPFSYCINTPGSFSCGSCQGGYTKVGDGTGPNGCMDIDECNSTTRCTALANCTNFGGGYNCSACPPGYQGSGYTNCTDINECFDEGRCPLHSKCQNNIPGFNCTCDAGFRGNGSTCTDCGIPSCQAYASGMPQCQCTSCSAPFYADGSGNCTNCLGCPAGQARVGCGGNSSGTCMNFPCPVGSTGTNLFANNCTCNPGLSGTITPTTAPPYYSGACNNCNTANCSTYCNAPNCGCNCTSCLGGTNTWANASTGTCQFCSNCSSGFFLSGCGGASNGTCSACNGSADVLCSVFATACDCSVCVDGYYVNASQKCTPCMSCAPGKHLTGCGPGPSPGTCQDVPCPPNTVGTVVASGCNCSSGYSGTITATTTPPFFTGVCVDIDECANSTNLCRQNKQLCFNDIPGYHCQACPIFFESTDGVTCVDINECTTCPNGVDCPCANGTNCTNDQPRYHCSPCPPGFTGNSDIRNEGTFGCFDIDECDIGLCAPPDIGSCTNFVGGFNCTCPSGYTISDSTCLNCVRQCMDNNECATGNGGCDILTDCVNLPGTFECGPCPIGFSGNGSTGCQDINECLPVSPCALSSACHNVNLKTAGLNKDSCICQFGECASILIPPFPGSGGKYGCTSYDRVTTNTQTSMLCDVLQNENNGSTWSLSLTTRIRSTALECNQAKRWNIVSGSTIVARSQRAASRPLPSDQLSLQWLLPNCVTQLGCTEVLSCDASGRCNLLPSTCFFSGNPLANDQNVNLTLCPVSSQLTVDRCPFVNTVDGPMECFTVSAAGVFEANGQYVCRGPTFTDASGCLVYRNSNGYDLQLVTVGPTSSDCADTFSWHLADGMGQELVATTTNPNGGPRTANWPIGTFDTCTQTFTCDSCPPGYDGSAYVLCDDINECLVNRGGCDPYQDCLNSPGNSSCSACYPGYAGPPCIPTTNTATLRVSIRNANTSVLTVGESITVGVFLGAAAPTSGSPIFTTTVTTGTAIFTRPVNSGGYTIDAFSGSNWAGGQSVNFVAGEDIFLTTYYVPRGLITGNVDARAIVLTWQSKDTGTSNVDLDLVVLKYDTLGIGPTPGSCASAGNNSPPPQCCAAFPLRGDCGPLSVLYDTTTTNGVEMASLKIADRISASSNYFSHLVYVRYFGSNPEQLKKSNAQIRMFARSIFPGWEIEMEMATTATQFNDPSFKPMYWVAFCRVEVGTGTAYSLKRLGNFTDVEPTSQTAYSQWCL